MFCLIRAIPGRCLRGLLLVCIAHSAVQACNYHDPKTIAIGWLMWRYPESGHVTGAIWQAQQAGKLPWPDTERLMATGAYRKELDAEAFEKTKQDLHRLGVGMGLEAAAGRIEQFSMVMVENGLWSWFSISRMQQTVAVDVNGPGIGKLVVVTDEPVLRVIVQGEMTLSEAVATGLMKLYGDPEETNEFLNAFGNVGGRKLAPYFNRSSIEYKQFGAKP